MPNKPSVWISLPRIQAVLAVLSLFFVSCQRSAEPTVPISAHGEALGPPWFEDVTEQAGLDFVHDPGPVGTYFLPQIIGSGAALFDYDNDGRLDIYLLQNAGPNARAANRLFRQQPDGRFQDASAGSGLDIAGHHMGVAIGDADNDGWPDVLVSQYGSVRLFRNNGNGTFADITQDAGLDNLSWGVSTCFVDYDRDGWLDLVIVNYVDYVPGRRCTMTVSKPDYCHPRVFESSVTRLYRNLGPRAGKTVAFQDVTLSSGIGRLPGAGLGVLATDFNGDGWPDIFVANDAQPNRLWINQRDGTFHDEAVLRGVAYNGLGQAQGNMGVAWGDVDGDGLLDLFVTHLTEETHTLWKQRPVGLFQDRTAAAGLARPRWHGTGFGTVLADFNQDGALDLALVNGRVSRAPNAPERHGRFDWSDYAERNQLFANDGSGRMRDIFMDNVAFCGTANVARGLASGDIDGDGALDLLVTTVGGRARLYRNVAPRRGHWLLVRALDPSLRRDAYGARVTITAGTRRWVGCVNPGSSYLCSNDPRVHFGLGEAGRIDAIQVLWPDGKAEDFPGRKADQVVVLRKGEGTAVRK